MISLYFYFCLTLQPSFLVKGLEKQLLIKKLSFLITCHFTDIVKVPLKDLALILF